MEKLVRRTSFIAALIAALVFSAANSGQVLSQEPITAQKNSDRELPTATGSNPKPEDPTNAILAAFDKYEVVGMDAAHGNKDLDDLILHLIRDPAFPSKVNDVVVECGNSLYQAVLDRYIAGNDVPLSEVRQVWRNGQMMCAVSGFYEELFPLLRRINQRLPLEKRLRVLAGDPPLDWSRVNSRSDIGADMLDRDLSIASVMEKEVLSKHRKALMLFGTFHLFHGSNSAPIGLESAVQRYEKDYPGVTFVIGDAMIFPGSTAPPNDEWKARMASWPIPSIVQNIKGTWLEDVDKPFFSKMVDAYLYLGPPELMLAESRPAEIFSNKAYMAELRRRAAIIGDEFITDQTNPDKLSDQNFSPFLFGPVIGSKAP